MHILIKNKKLIINDYKVKCAIGKRGIGIKKREGDYITPEGKFRIKYILYRKDRVINFKSKIKKLAIKRNMGWCNDSNSKKYNKLIKLPFKSSAEKLYRLDNAYDIILVLNFNANPIIKNKGSAIFIHVAKKNYKSTEGCVAVSKQDLRKIIKMINRKTIVSIN
jgi:L,D-peptidoglycan transpeptidase YkuD (ErfK/YbiS/YcfS/YnhG family)